MGLSKLLAVSRSVRSLTEEPTRYKMTQQNLLPTFGGAKSAETETEDEVSPAAEAAPQPGTADPAATTAAGGSAGAGRSDVVPDNAAAFLEATKKLRPFGGVTWFKNPFARTAANKQENRPVQTELSLDSVRPVRNDLSDSDFELGRAPGQSSEAAGISTAPKAVPTVAPVAAGGLWQRLKTRLFGATNAD
jgi:hypothetical protein